MAITSSKTLILALARVSPIAAACLWSLPAQAQNLITNGTFDTDYAPWWSNAATGSGPNGEDADQTMVVTDGQLCSTSTIAGKNTWDVIIGLSDLPLVAGQHYHISFKASADADHKIRFKTGLGEAPYTDYFIWTIPLTTTPQVVDFTYQNLKENPASHFQFHIGKTPGTVCIDDVVVEPVAAPPAPAYTTPSKTGQPLKSFSSLVKMGTAVDTGTFLSSPLHNAIVAAEFSMITPANSMKMNNIQPVQDKFDWIETDALMAYAAANGLEFRGHPLVWHTQTPGWLTTGISEGTIDAAATLGIMDAHINELMGHTKGRIPYWDVVNEAVDQVDGAWGLRKTIWSDQLGPTFIDHAFQTAAVADPAAQLFYNDYNIEQKGNAKADYVFDMIKSMKERSIPIHGVGLQSHYYVEPNGATASGVPNMQAIRDNMARYNDIGVEVHITECDFRIGLPADDAKTQHQVQFYHDLLQVCIDAPNCSHFTVWGLSDYDSWVPSTFADYDFAHIFDKALAPKPAYHAFSDVFAAAAPAASGCSFAAPLGGGAPWQIGLLASLGLSAWARMSSRRRASR